MRQGREREATKTVFAFKEPLHVEARPRERNERSRFLPSEQKRLFMPECVEGAIIRAKRVSNCYIQEKEN